MGPSQQEVESDDDRTVTDHASERDPRLAPPDTAPTLDGDDHAEWREWSTRARSISIPLPAQSELELESTQLRRRTAVSLHAIGSTVAGTDHATESIGASHDRSAGKDDGNECAFER